MKHLSASDYKDIWIHQSKLMWSRLQTLTVVNFAVFGAWWKIEVGEILYLGAAFNALIFLAIFRDSNYLKWLKIKKKIPEVKGCITGVWIAGSPPVLLCVLSIFLAQKIDPESLRQEEQKLEVSEEKIVLDEINQSLKEIVISLEKMSHRLEPSNRNQENLVEQPTNPDIEEQSEPTIEPID